MFCSKCGKQLSEGALFCSFCGTKVELENTAVPTGSYVVEKPSYKEDAEPAKQVKPASPMLFDWSNVIDESRKKKVPANLKSPWDPTGVDEETVSSNEKVIESVKKPVYSDDDLFSELEKPATEPTRTMSFIDMLRAERDEKEKKAAADAREVTEKAEETFDYSAFDEKADMRYTQILPNDEREHTMGYTDIGADLVEEIKKADEIASADSELDEYIRLRQEARKENVVSEPEEPQRFVVPAKEEQKNIEAAYEEKTDNLSEELAAILGGGNGFASDDDTEESDIDLFDGITSEGDRFAIEDEDEDDDIDVSAMLDIYGGDDEEDEPAEDDVEDEYEESDDDEVWNDDDNFDVVADDSDDDVADEYEKLDVAAESSEKAEEPAAPSVERAPKEDISSIIAGILGEDAAEPEADEDDIDDVDDDLDIDAYVDDADEDEEVAEPVAAPVVEEKAKDSVESEIEALKKRLAELMGDSLEEPEAVAKPEALDIDALVSAPVAEAEPAAPAVEEAPVETPEVAEAPAEPAAPSYDDVFSADLDNIADEEDVLEAAAVAEPVIPMEEVAPVAEPQPVVTDDMSFEAAPEVLDLDAELASLGFDVESPAKAEPEAVVEETPVAEAPAEAPAVSAEPVDPILGAVADALKTNAEAPAPKATDDAQDIFAGVEDAVSEAPASEDELADAISESVEANDTVEEALVPETETSVNPIEEFDIDSLLAQADAEPAVETEPEVETDAMSIEELERDLFGDATELDGEAEATRKIDKFYTLYKKNEEFQRLLDEEYSKLQGVESSEDLDSFFEIGAEENTVDPVEAFAAQQQPIGQMSMPAAAEAEARSFVEAKEPAAERPVVPAATIPSVEAKSAPVLEDDTHELSKKELKAQQKAAKKAAKKAKAEADDYEDEGGNALTIIAVVIAVILVLLLAMILIMNFAPDSGLGMKLNMFFENITSYLSAADVMNDDFLL